MSLQQETSLHKPFSSREPAMTGNTGAKGPVLYPESHTFCTLIWRVEGEGIQSSLTTRKQGTVPCGREISLSD